MGLVQALALYMMQKIFKEWFNWRQAELQVMPVLELPSSSILFSLLCFSPSYGLHTSFFNNWVIPSFHTLLK
jgi:hypothetical protein